MVLIPAGWEAVRLFVGLELHQTSEVEDRCKTDVEQSSHEEHACHRQQFQLATAQGQLIRP
jgi:hypothetical protein